MKIAACGLAAFVAVGTTGPCVAEGMVTAAQFADTRLLFLLKPTVGNATLSVTGPNDFHVSAFSRIGAPGIDLSAFGPLDEGTYNYQMTASGPERVPVRTPLDNGRGRRPEPTQPVGLSMSGTFQIKGGVIVKPDHTKPERRDR